MLKKVVTSYAQYNYWANEKMTRWLKTLDRNILYRQTPSSFNSIDLTLQHMCHAQNFWLTVLAEGDIEALDETVKINSVDSVISDLLHGSSQMINTFTVYSDEDLLKKVSNPATIQARYEFMLHVINHNSYHRGQIVTMIRSLGIINNIPNTDYDVFLETGGIGY
jgi:uncharacterized damage-inducible protein DinB